MLGRSLFFGEVSFGEWFSFCRITCLGREMSFCLLVSFLLRALFWIGAFFSEAPFWAESSFGELPTVCRWACLPEETCV